MNQAILITFGTPLFVYSIHHNFATSTTIQTGHKPGPTTSSTRLPPNPPLHTCGPQYPPQPTRLVQLRQLLQAPHVPPLHEHPRQRHRLSHQLLHLPEKLPVQRHVALVEHHAVRLQHVAHPVAVLVRLPHAPQRRRVHHHRLAPPRRTLLRKRAQWIPPKPLERRFLLLLLSLQPVPHYEHVVLQLAPSRHGHVSHNGFYCFGLHCVGLFCLGLGL
ncbi:hypothetical protein V8G54_002053 [Vigna mungo]|uniref:Uncharacterized protein n=1 Tax=Vigna mungo TaxID=3915 RepID=A0AAQ3SCH4_VIGMU